MIVTESILSGETIDILQPLNYLRYIPLYSKETKNLSTEIIGIWRIIPRTMYIMRPYPDNKPLGAKLNEFIRIEFRTDGNAYHLVDWPKDKKATWKVLFNNNTCVLDCQVKYYSKNQILFYDGDIIFTDEYILVKEDSIDKFSTFQNLIGYLSNLQISAFFYVNDKRRDILKKTGSKNKANEYIDSHQDDIVCRLCPRFKTFKTSIINWFDSIF